MSVRTVCSCSSSEWSWQHFQLSLTNSGPFFIPPDVRWTCCNHFHIWSSGRRNRCTDVTMQQRTRKKCMFNCVIFIFLMYICISDFPSSRKGLFKTVLYFHFMVCGVTQSVFLALLISKILCCSFVDRLLLKLHGSIFCVATTIVHVCDVSADAADVGWR